jgi:hypothetical protein
MNSMLHTSGQFMLRQMPMLALLFVWIQTPSLMADKPRKNRHSITPMLGIARNTTTPLTLSPAANLRIQYLNGDQWRNPFMLRYDYRLNKGSSIGGSLLLNYSPLYLNPQFNNGMFIGPGIINHAGTMPGLAAHYSGSLSLGLVRLFGSFGLGAYRQFPHETLSADYSWYKNAPAAFYDFAVASTHQSIRRLLPISILNAGVKFKQLEFSWVMHRSLWSPVRPFEYNGATFKNNIRFRSSGFYVAYQIKF